MPLITRAIRRAQSARVFDEIWISSESEDFLPIAETEGVGFHKRQPWLGSDTATSEDFIADFLNIHETDLLVQVHSVTPLLPSEEIAQFVRTFQNSEADCFFSVRDTLLECVYNNEPINFVFSEKANSQELMPVHEICWGITGWRSGVFKAAAKQGKCATYAGRRGFLPSSRFGAIVIKTEEDLQMAEALFPLASKVGWLG